MKLPLASTPGRCAAEIAVLIARILPYFVKTMRFLLDRLHVVLQRLRFRYDVFISYARRDSSEYSERLKQQLEKLDFTCFLDQHELPAGDALNESLRRAIRRSARLVLIGSPAAAMSKHVARELEEFEKTGRPVIPIEFGGSLTETSWPFLQSRDVIWIDETVESLTRSIPSPVVVDGIDRAFDLRKRNSVRRMQVMAVTATFLAGASIAAWMIARATAARQDATQKLVSARMAAVASAAQSREEKGRAERASADARTATAVAAAAKLEAQKNIVLARERLTDLSQEAGRLELQRGRGQQAFVHLRDAFAHREEDEPLRFLLRAARRSLVPILSGHPRNVDDVRWSPSGDSLLTRDGEVVHLWDANGKSIAFLRHHGQETRARFADFVLDGKQILTVSDRASLWDARGQFVRDLRPSADWGRVQLCCDRTKLITEVGKDARLVDVSTGSVVGTLPWSSDAGAALDRTGRRAAVIAGGSITPFDVMSSQPLGPVLKEDGVSYRGAVWSPDGRYLLGLQIASGMVVREKSELPGPAPVTVWKLPEGRIVAHLESRGPMIHAAAFSADGTKCVTGDNMGNAIIWDVAAFEGPDPAAESKVLAREGDPPGLNITYVAFNPDGRIVVTGSDEGAEIKLWNADIGTLHRRIFPEASEELNSLRFSPDGKAIAGAVGKMAMIWDAGIDLRRRFISGSDRVEMPAFSGDRRRYAVDDGGVIQIYDSHREIVSVEEKKGERLAELNDDGSRILATTEDTCVVIETGTGKSWPVPRPKNGTCSISPSGREVLTVGGDPKEIVLHSIGRAKPGKRTLQLEKLDIGGFHPPVFAADGSLVAMAGVLMEGHGNLQTTVWSTATGERLYARPGRAPVFSRDGKTLALVSTSGWNVLLFDSRTGKRFLATKSFEYPLNHVALSRDGQRVAAASQHHTFVIDVTSGHVLTLGTNAWVQHAEFSPTGKRIITADFNGQVLMWDAVRGQLLFTLSGHRHQARFATFMDDGATALSCASDISGSDVIEWDVGLESCSLAELDWMIEHWVDSNVMATVVREARH